MCNLNEIEDTDRADEATRWGIWEEFNLRQEAWEQYQTLKSEGVVGAFRRVGVILAGEGYESPDGEFARRVT